MKNIKAIKNKDTKGIKDTKVTQIIVNDVIKAIEELAPLRYAEDWDNPGLMAGSRNMPVTGILTTLDVTLEAIDEIRRQGGNTIISHHPLIFKGIKKVDFDTYTGRILKELITHDIAVYSAHTNLDIAPGGLNDMLAQRLSLQQVRGLEQTGEVRRYKLVCFVPETHSEALRHAIADAGAGYIGKYSGCSFSAVGEGRFQPEEGAQPLLGTIGVLETVKEERVETIVPEPILPEVLAAMKKAHPYEEVAYDVYPLVEPADRQWLGRVGELPQAMTFEEFQTHLAKAMPKARLRFAGTVPAKIKTVALCTGAGAEFLGRAKRCGADAYVTGDVKYHEAQLAKELGILVADGGHFGTEECVASGLAAYLKAYALRKGWRELTVQAFDGQKDFFF